MQAILVYTTCPNEKEAKYIAGSLIKSKIAGCVNIFPNMKSFYFWENNLQEDNEIVLIIKTISSSFEKVKDHIINLHSYKIPCIIRLDISDIHKPYMDWLKSNIKL